MQALRTAATGHGRPAAERRGHLEQHRQHEHRRLQEQRAEFQDLLYQTLEQAGAQSSDQGTIVPTGVQVGAGVKAGSVYRITTQGAMTRTDNKLDLAINGRGYFQVLMPSGETAYTRAGNFSVNDQGQLVTQDGYLVQPAIIDPAGRHRHHHLPVRPGAGDPARPDRAHTSSASCELATFINEARPRGAGRQPLQGDRRLRRGRPPARPAPPGFGTLMQGYTEASNVDAVTEITALIVAQRAYEMNSKVISTADNMLGVANQVKSLGHAPPRSSPRPSLASPPPRPGRPGRSTPEGRHRRRRRHRSPWATSSTAPAPRPACRSPRAPAQTVVLDAARRAGRRPPRRPRLGQRRGPAPDRRPRRGAGAAGAAGRRRRPRGNVEVLTYARSLAAGEIVQPQDLVWGKAAAGARRRARATPTR